MAYSDHLQPWLVVRLLPNMQRVVVARFRTESDADGYCQIVRQLMPAAKFIIVFDADPDRPQP